MKQRRSIHVIFNIPEIHSARLYLFGFNSHRYMRDDSSLLSFMVSKSVLERSPLHRQHTRSLIVLKLLLLRCKGVCSFRSLDREAAPRPRRSLVPSCNGVQPRTNTRYQHRRRVFLRSFISLAVAHAMNTEATVPNESIMQAVLPAASPVANVISPAKGNSLSFRSHHQIHQRMPTCESKENLVGALVHSSYANQHRVSIHHVVIFWEENRGIEIIGMFIY